MLYFIELQKRKDPMKLHHVTTSMVNGSVTEDALYTMVQLVEQSRMVKTV